MDPKNGATSFQLLDGYVNYLNGYIDDFRIYATTMSANQIQQLYSSKAYLTNHGEYLSKGNIKDVDFYHGFEGQVADTRGFTSSIGGGTWNWGASTGSRFALNVSNNVGIVWDVALATTKTFKRPAVLYGQVKYDGTSGNYTMNGWRDMTVPTASWQYHPYTFYCSNLSALYARIVCGSVAINYGPLKNISSSTWYDYKIELLNPSGAKFYWRTPSVEKEWSILYTDLTASVGQTDYLAPSMLKGDTNRTWTDNWAVSSLDNKISYYGDIHSNEFNEIGMTKNLIMWSLNGTTDSYVSGSGNIYPLTASTNTILYTEAQDKIYNAALLNYTASGMTTEFFNFPKISTYSAQPWIAMFWIYTSGSKLDYDILGESGSSNSTLGTDSSGRPFFRSSGGTTVTDTTGIVLIPNSWNHIAYNYFGNSIGFFVNGIRGGTTYYVGSASINFNCIGLAGNSTTRIFSGKICDVRLYLSSDGNLFHDNEVHKIYNLTNKNSVLMMSGSNKNIVYSKKFGENY